MTSQTTIEATTKPWTPVAAGRFPAIRIGGTLTLTILGVYMAVLHNRYMPIHEGWFSEYGRYLLQGKLPYRDFYFFGQPLPLFISALLVKLGDRLIYMRYYGVVERILLYGILYFVLSRRFSAAASSIGTLAPAVFFLSYSTDAFYSYLYTCLFFLMLAAASLQAAYRFPARRRLFLILAGGCASMSFFAKQSNGLLGTAAIFFCVALLSRDFREACNDLGYAALGWIGAALPFAAWLSANGIWRPYFEQVYRGAAQSKGTFRTIFLQCFLRMREPMSVDTAVVLAFAAAFLVHEKKVFLRGDGIPDRNERRRILYYLAAGTVAIFLPSLWRLTPLHVYWTAELAMYVVRLSVYWLAAMVLWLLYRRFSGAGLRLAGDETVVILALTGAAWLYGSGASFMFEQQSVIPALALLLAFFYDRVSFPRSDLMRKIVIALSLVMVADAAMEKYTIAFTWVGWREQVAQNAKSSHWKELQGYRLNEETVRVYDTILDDIATRASPSDGLFTFPAMPMFNYVTRHPQPTFGLVHYWDVCPDWLALADAKRLKEARPRFIVNMDMPEDIWQYHEAVFRLKRVSGQRAIQNVIDDFIASGDYKLLREFDSAYFKYPIYLWWREK